MGYIIVFLIGAAVGIFTMALAAANKDDNTHYSINDKK